MIMYTFFEEKADVLSGKTLVPFNTHAGSRLCGFDKKLTDAISDSNVAVGLTMSGQDAQSKQDKVREDVDEWLDGPGF